MEKIARSLSKTSTLLLDEAYIDYVEDPVEKRLIGKVTHISNLIVVRTFSKYFGLAGLRIGYAALHDVSISAN